MKIAVNGAGAAAIAITKLLISAGAKDVTLCDCTGAIYQGREHGMNWIKNEIAEITNLNKTQGKLALASFPPDAATIPTRSTMCWRFPESFAALLMFAQATSTRP